MGVRVLKSNQFNPKSSVDVWTSKEIKQMWSLVSFCHSIGSKWQSLKLMSYNNDLVIWKELCKDSKSNYYNAFKMQSIKPDPDITNGINDFTYNW